MDNNEFWLALDKLISESNIIVDRPKGSKHTTYNFIYEVDYGYIENTSSMDGNGIDVWVGSLGNETFDAIICTVDLLKRDSEIKILIGCNENEKNIIFKFHNDGFMKGIMFRRK